MAFLPPGTPEWLLALCLIPTVVAGVILSLAGPVRATEVLLQAIAGLLRSFNAILEEWRKLRRRK